jgi:replicative DNA helicase
MRDPYSHEAECGVLGAMLIKPELIDMLSADLAEADFYWQNNRDTYRAILSLRAEGKAVDFLTVAERMGVNIADTAELQRNTPSAANAQEYARIVKARSLDRSLINAAQTIHEIAHSDSATADKVSAAQAEVLAIDGTAASQEIIHAGDVMRAHIEELERREELKGAMDGLSTGLADLDAKINGLKPEQLIVVAGRAKMGKTTFAMGIARHNAIRAKKQVLVVSLEMSNAQIMDRLIAAEGGVPLGALKDGSATTQYNLEVTAAAGKIMNSGLCLSERPGLTISRIRSMARRHKMMRGLDLLIIDHLGLIDAEDSSMNTLARVSEITRQSKLLARELKIPVILLSQLNRALEQRADRRPMPSDLRDSGTIEQDADLVFFVYRDEVYDPNSAHKGIAEIIVGIARDVEQCTVFTSYQGQYNRFMDLAQGQHIPELRTEKKTRGVNF